MKSAHMDITTCEESGVKGKMDQTILVRTIFAVGVIALVAFAFSTADAGEALSVASLSNNYVDCSSLLLPATGEGLCADKF